MRLLLALPAVLCLAPTPGPVALVYAPAAGTTLERIFSTSFELELESMSMSLDGEEVPAEYLDEMEGTILSEETRIVTDVLAEVSGGRATRLVRTFDLLASRDLRTFEAGEEPEQSLNSSALQGKSVVFTWNTEEDRHDVAYAEGEEGEAALLEGLEEDMDLRALLPDGEVELGSSWELDAAVYDGILLLGGDVTLLPDGEGEPEDSAARDEQLEENTDGEVRATFVELRESEGQRYAVVRLEFDVSTYWDEPTVEEGDLEEGIPTMEGSWRTVLGVEATGELLWDLAGGHALSLEIEGTLTMTMKQEMRGEMEGESVESTIDMVFRGPTKTLLALGRS